MDERLRTLFRTALDLADSEAAGLSESDSIHTVSNWDSLGHMRLILALEKEYSISVPDEEAIRLVTVAHINVYLDAAATPADRLTPR